MKVKLAPLGECRSAATGVPALGRALSMATVRLPALPVLPARSVAVALMVLLAVSAGISPLAKLVLQLPPVAVTVLVVLPQVTSTLAPASAVPPTVTPAVFSAALTMLSTATAEMEGVPGARVSMLMAGVEPAPPLLPAPSAYGPEATLMPALPEARPAVGVKVAVRVRPLPLRAPKVPLLTTTSPFVPSQVKLPPGSSLKVKVMVAVCPALRVGVLLVIASVGARVSMLMAGVTPAPPSFPARSV